MNWYHGTRVLYTCTCISSCFWDNVIFVHVYHGTYTCTYVPVYVRTYVPWYQWYVLEYDNHRTRVPAVPWYSSTMVRTHVYVYVQHQKWLEIQALRCNTMVHMYVLVYVPWYVPWYHNGTMVLARVPMVPTVKHSQWYTSHLVWCNSTLLPWVRTRVRTYVRTYVRTITGMLFWLEKSTYT
jgi:hypothetical protein